MKDVITHNIEVIGKTEAFNVAITTNYESNGVSIYTITCYADSNFTPHPITLKWKIPAINVKGVWKPTTDFSKRIMDDWELDHMESRISVDSPIISLFGHDDNNIHTFACSDPINTTELNALYREEDNYMYCHITLFKERHHDIREYQIQLRVDEEDQHFSKSLNNVGAWWGNIEHLKPIKTPDLAKVPVYSTWYQFHQKLDTDELIKECEIASKLGYELIILDDGWQTKDENRGYDFTGDWQPERIPKMQEFVASVHKTGMKLALWYSVPFCGKHSKAYQKFQGKFLTEEHRWAPVFDPRYPEVRAHLIQLYTNALKDWNIDGFKLDFIDEFKVYPSTTLTKENGRDFSSVNLAVDRLMTDVMAELHAINPEVVIEFRQKYTGPAMRKYGNMFRAFDCPGDSVMNRVRIADLKMLSGRTAVHSDMFTYHHNEPLEIKALQLVNTLFGVPQLSILLQEASDEELAMIKFYTQYWRENVEILLNGDFEPQKPLANYPILKAGSEKLTIIGVYDNYIIDFKEKTNRIDIINGQNTEKVVLSSTDNHGAYNCSVYDCTGKKINDCKVMILIGVVQIKVPPCGLIKLEKNI
ncbi:alpha-galactosidase [Aquimarina sp. AD10]|uniref:Glycosidase n=1 Tax=Aquimarina aggregata TaxID=1642818 RepID=A0A163D3N4_9FLAO|nr:MULTISPECIES: glycoside hydrolase family 36 protein [Aquimarina]AXT62606.1 alpha-galactosidase [Aquimarina sp. AD10]KZS42970.1 glycosidase [Aquimarina aggregata]RKM97790.1 alpha-galactosidase [Aquimarina sp. AD10]